ncbi:MAG TPA: heavy-metal-associated domain-containing protein [Roseiflexaceae bacterium]|nr:heavy-metal-associated domain-containing protein [Roseiflexaceae bacterium]
MQRSSDSDIRAGSWGVAAGLVGSLCCIGPSAAVLLGLGSSALFGLSLDRGPALLGGAALLLVGLGFALRHARACQLSAVARWRAPALMLISFAVAYGLLGVFAPAVAARQEEAAAGPAAQPQSPSMAQGLAVVPSQRRLTLIVDKMYCPPCASHIRSALRRHPAVRAFVAEAYIDQVTIDYDSSQTSAKKLVALFPASYGITQLGDQAIQ